MPGEKPPMLLSDQDYSPEIPDPAGDIAALADPDFAPTFAEMVAADHCDGEFANNRLGLAVSLLNNHAPMFGCRTAIRPEDGDLEAALLMDGVPAAVRDAIGRAMVAAAGFAERCFVGDEDGTPEA